MGDSEKSPRWLEWAREIQALGQTGLTFSQNEYERERNTRLVRLASEILAGYTDLDRESVRTNMMAQPGYATPKIDVRGVVIREGRVLLVREAQDGRWALPGGWVDVGERPAASVTREIREESGFETEVRKVIGVFDANRDGRPLELYHAFKIIFWCTLTGGSARPSHETPEVGFFDFDDAPALSSNRTHPRHLAEIRRHLEDPDRPTYFE